jgi:hypothetical protein
LYFIKRNSVVMNNIYHKITVVSVGLALGFALGANKEAKAATITLKPTDALEVNDTQDLNGNPGSDGIGDWGYDVLLVKKSLGQEARVILEFNIGNLSLATNAVISRAIFLARIYNRTPVPGVLPTQIYGYVGDGKTELSDFQAGVILAPSLFVGATPGYYNTPIPFDILSFNVTQFVNERVSNRDAFAEFGIRISNDYPYNDYRLQEHFPYNGSFQLTDISLVVETTDIAEPVPEPGTLFGSALALGVGGWLKRKRSSQHNKTMP